MSDAILPWAKEIQEKDDELAIVRELLQAEMKTTDELQERIQQLKKELAERKAITNDLIDTNERLIKACDALVEAIQTHKDSFIGLEGDIVPEDEALWAVLPKENDK